MKRTRITGIFGIVIAFAVVVLIGVIALTTDRAAQVYAAEEKYNVEDCEYNIEIWLNEDCSIDINQILEQKKREFAYYIGIHLNGHTLTVEKPFSTRASSAVKISNGSVVFNNSGKNSGTMCTHYGGLELDHVNFTANCQCLFALYGDAWRSLYKGIQVTNCNFTNCKFSDRYGGAFYFSEDGECPLTFTNNRFYNCESNCSLIYIGDLWSATRSESHHVKFDMSGCKFHGCKNGYGCIYINAAYVDIGALDDNAILNSIDCCESSGYGGAIYVGDYHGYGSIRGFVCTHNRSNNNYGGAIYLAGDGEVIDNCYFIGNSATENGYGGAIYFEEDYTTVKNSYFTENEAYKGGAIYNNGKTNAVTDCYFVYNTAKKGWSNDIYYPTNVTGSHFHNSNKDTMFDENWDYYFTKYSDSYNNKNCTTQDSKSFFKIPGGGLESDPFVIKDESCVFFLYTGLKQNINPIYASYVFEIRQNNLVWFDKIPNFRGTMDGNETSLFMQGDATSLMDGGEVHHYLIENHTGISRHEMPEQVDYYVFNEDSKQFEKRTHDVKYLPWDAAETAIPSGTYYVIRDITYKERVDIRGNVTLIFNEGVTFTAEKGIRLNDEVLDDDIGKNTLTLAAVTTDKEKVGKLVAKGHNGDAAIGGNKGIDKNRSTAGETCGNFYDHGVTLEITSKDEGCGIGGGRAGESDNQYVPDSGNGGTVKICGATATITAVGAGIGGGEGHRSDRLEYGRGGSGGRLSLINTDLTIKSDSIGIGGGTALWNGNRSAPYGGSAKDGIGTELSIYGGTLKVYSGYGKAISAHKEGAENYGEQELKALGSGLKVRYGTDEGNTNAFGSYKLKELATAKYVEIVGESYNDNFASLVSGGSLIIISVIAVIALITAGVFAALYFKQRKKAEMKG